jgi:hypothetical protein
MRAWLLPLVLGSAIPALADRPIDPPVVSVKAEGKTGIQWSVTPAEAVVFLDGKKLGSAGDLTFTKASPGKHTIRITKGGDEQEMEVKVVKGQVLQVTFSFDE